MTLAFSNFLQISLDLYIDLQVMSQVEIIFNENVILRLSFVIFTKNAMPHNKGPVCLKWHPLYVFL